MSEEQILLSARGLVKRFKTVGGPLTVLDGLNLDIAAGTMLYIIGRSGAGKTTLLHLLGGLDQPEEGTVFCRGKDLNKLSEREKGKFRNGHLGFVFQFYHLLPELTLLENVLLPARIGGKRKEESQKRALDLLDRMELSERRQHYPSQLSGGEQQRAAVARALVNGPDLVLCDEPTGNLDQESALKMMDLVNKLNREYKQTFCIVTHEESLVKNRPNVFRLEGGQLHRLDHLRSVHS